MHTKAYTRLRGLRGPIVRTHPLTGEPIEPLGVVGGKVVWPMMGGAPDDDDDDDDNDDDSDDAGDSDDDGDDDSGDDDSSGDDDKADDDKVSKSDFDKLKERMRQADKRRADVEKELQQLKDKDKPDLERAQARVSELEDETASLKSEVSSLRLSNAFLTSNKHTWHDAETALALADKKGMLDDVVDSDGEVDKKALTSALDRLAKEHKYLLADAKKSDDDKDKTASGRKSGGRSKNVKDKKAREKELAGRMPVLNR
jgi:hypothetical protein